MHINPFITDLLHFQRLGLLLAACIISSSVCLGQTTPHSQDTALATKSVHSGASGLEWSHLSAQKQQSLQPLQQVWPHLSEAHQRKWLTLARKFPKMTSDEKSKLHSRMVEWAALKPKDRQLARLNFAETKKLSPEERAANWEAYQALSPEDRQILTEQALAKKGNSGALSSRLTKNQRLITIAPRRTPPESLRALMEQQNSVNSRTLLPLLQAQLRDPL